MTAHAVVFDVNETMLDLGALDPLFAAWFGNPAARREWFAKTLHYALTLAATRQFRGFAEAGRAALVAIADRHGAALPDDASAKLREALIHLPAHEDVAPALHLLRNAGFRTAALSNNPLEMLLVQLRFAGLAPLFDEVISVDEVGTLKPAPEVYNYAASRLQLVPTSVWMVAAHGWDVAGAVRAGLRGAFVARPGQLPDPFAPPEVSATNLVDLAHTIVAAAPRPA